MRQIRTIGTAAAALAVAATLLTGQAAQAAPAATLTVQFGAPAAFGIFTPGVARTYDTGTTALVNSTADGATLTIHDPSSVATGRLVNGEFALPSPVKAAASSAAGLGSSFADVPGSASPLTFLSYTGPVANDAVAVLFRQDISDSTPLAVGDYGKALTVTASITAPCTASTTFTVFIGTAGQATAPSSGSASCSPPTPPDCSAVTASPASILPATRDAFTRITLTGATATDGGGVTYRVDAVTQDEPISGVGIGDTTTPDARLAGDRVEVRSERNPKGNGRVYRIAYTAADASGQTCTGTVAVSVLRKKGEAAIDDHATGGWNSFTGARLG